MSSGLIQLLVLLGVAVFLVLKLRSVLGTRDGFEGTSEQRTEMRNGRASNADFEVIDGGKSDRDIADHIAPDSAAGQALAAMKQAEPSFNVGEFMGGARQAYEMILMAFENGDRSTLESLLEPEVFDSFSAAIDDREEKGLEIDANFVGLRELKLRDAEFDPATGEADITLSFVGELTSVVKDAAGKIVEGSKSEFKRQNDVWTFTRHIGSDNPNWLLAGTGE